MPYHTEAEVSQQQCAATFLQPYEVLLLPQDPSTKLPLLEDSVDTKCRNVNFTTTKIISCSSPLATGWTVRGSNLGGGEIFRSRPDRLWGPPSLLYNGYRVFQGGKAAVAWRWPPTPSSAQVKERVELYLYSPSGSSWPVLGWTLPFTFTSPLHESI